MCEAIKLPFGVVSEVGLRKGMLDGNQDPHGQGQFWGF